MANLSYGSPTGSPCPVITLDTLQTTTFNQEVEYDPSGSNYLGTRITITVHAILNRSNMPATANETPAQTMVRIRKTLLTQGLQLVFNQGPDVLISCPVAGAQIDPMKGPKPKSLNVVQITEETFIIDYTIECFIIECCPPGSTLPYLSNRWSETLTIDSDFYTKRVIAGLVIFRGDQINDKNFNSGQFPDEYRSLIGPRIFTIPPNFVRESIELTVPEDGLGLHYVITDQEVYSTAPGASGGAVKYSGEHVTTASKGSIYNEAIVVRITGAPGAVSKAQLISNAITLILGRLANLTKGSWIRAGYIKDTLEKNEIEVRVETIASDTTRYTPLHLTVPAAAVVAFGNLDYLLGQRSPDGTYNPGLTGPAQLAMTKFNSYLSLCGNYQSPPPAPPFVFPQTPTSPGPPTSLKIQTVPTLPQTPTILQPSSQSQSQGFYNEYQIQIDYESDRGNIILPYTDTSVAYSAIIPISNNIMKKIVKFKAERVGSPPALPNPDTTDQNAVLLHSTISPMSILPYGDSYTQVYSCTGKYVYGIINASLETINGGVTPDTTLSYQDSEFTNFMNGIIDRSA